MTTLKIAAAAGVALALAGTAAAQEVHEGDIEITIVGNKLTLSGGHEDLSLDGYRIFEGELGTFLSSGGNPRYKGDEPGFDTENGTFVTGTNIYFSGWSNLAYWNGSAWTGTVPTGEAFTVENELEETLTFLPSAFDPTGPLLLGAIDAVDNGKLHEHVDFVVDAAGNVLPATGAYRIGLFLSSNNYAASDYFYLVMNRGLDEAAFEGAIQAMAVPEPGTWATMGLGLFLLGLAGARRRRT
jgi:hypothetical protein